ncbi:MAG TPA: phage head closure protein [Vicinamibacterales bacterium]|nr:phage head closure protein [Vicinamibacterales bacterium]
MPSRAGTYRHQITLQTLQASADSMGDGGAESVASSIATRAAVEPLTGRERLRGEQTGAVHTHRVRMRYRPGVTVRTRVLFKGRRLDVHEVRNIEERNRELHLMCEEIQ